MDAVRRPRFRTEDVDSLRNRRSRRPVTQHRRYYDRIDERLIDGDAKRI